MDQFSVDWEDPTTTILALLLCGYILGDYLVQTNRVICKKQRSTSALAVHALEVGIVQGIVVLPFSCSLRGLLLVGGMALAHFVIDGIRIDLDRKYPKIGLWWLLCDQAAHFGVLLVVWNLWTMAEGVEITPAVGQVATLLAVIIFNVNGGSAIVAKTLEGLDLPQKEDDGPKGAGRIIGILERWMTLGLVWANQWGAVGLVLTAKSIARFKKMDEQPFAEVYLVGTMTSVLVAIVSGALLQLVLP